MIAKFVKENKGQLPVPVNTQQSTSKKRTSPSIDMKGAVALSATITAFLMALTLVQTGINSETMPQIGVAFVVSAISLIVFVIIERRIASPLVDLRLLKDKILLIWYMILMVTGITMFMAYPTIVQLVRSPTPLGFGGDAVDAGKCPASFHDNVPSVCKCHPTYHKSNRKTKTNHNRFANQSDWIAWTTDVSLYRIRSIY